MNGCGCDPTLAEALSDPMVKALMAADGVDPRELEADLTAMARTFEPVWLPARS